MEILKIRQVLHSLGVELTHILGDGNAFAGLIVLTAYFRFPHNVKR